MSGHLGMISDLVWYMWTMIRKYEPRKTEIWPGWLGYQANANYSVYPLAATLPEPFFQVRAAIIPRLEP